MNEPLVYVIILNYNGQRWVEPCLTALWQTRYKNYRTLFIDNASTDKSVELAKTFTSVEVLANTSNLGFAAGNNGGLRAALSGGAEYLVLLNPDTQVEPDWLRELVAVGEAESHVGILGAVQLAYGSDDWNSWTRSAMARHLAELAEPSTARASIPCDWVEGACLAIKREVVETVGLLDPIYDSFYEEIDWCRRARRFGYQVALVPRSRIHHYRGGSWTADEAARRRRDYLCDRGQFIFAVTDPERSLARNLVWYFITLGTKAKGLASNFNLTRLIDLCRIQWSLLRATHLLIEKWRRERALLSER